MEDESKIEGSVKSDHECNEMTQSVASPISQHTEDEMNEGSTSKAEQEDSSLEEEKKMAASKLSPSNSQQESEDYLEERKLSPSEAAYLAEEEDVSELFAFQHQKELQISDVRTKKDNIWITESLEESDFDDEDIDFIMKVVENRSSIKSIMNDTAALPSNTADKNERTTMLDSSSIKMSSNTVGKNERNIIPKIEKRKSAIEWSQNTTSSDASAKASSGLATLIAAHAEQELSSQTTDDSERPAMNELSASTPGAYAIAGPGSSRSLEALDDEEVTPLHINRRNDDSSSALALSSNLDVMVEATLVSEALPNETNPWSMNTLSSYGDNSYGQETSTLPHSTTRVVTDSVLISHAKSITPFCRRKNSLLLLSVIIGIVAAIVVPVVMHYLLSDEASESDTSAEEIKFGSILRRVTERGKLLCGVLEENFGGLFQKHEELENFSNAAICKAIAAAVFGTSKNRVEFVESPLHLRAEHIASGAVDVSLAYLITTMERNLYADDSAPSGVVFSSVYEYHVAEYAGRSEFVACAENNFQITGDCKGLRICVIGDTRIFDQLALVVPKNHLLAVNGYEQLYQLLTNEDCNVIIQPVVRSAIMQMRERGYAGEMVVGKTIMQAEPNGVCTANEDVEWSDFCNWVIQTILTAPRNFSFIQSDIFGEERSTMFQDIHTEIGHWEQFYEEYINPEKFPNAGLNSMNNGTTGLIRPVALGNTEALGPEPSNAGTMSAVLYRGKLRCAIRIDNRAGFATYDAESMKYRGIDVDFCRAVAAGIFGSDSNIEWVEASDNEHAFQLLHNKDVDLVSGMMVNLERDVREPSTGVGFSFTDPYFFNNSAMDDYPAVSDEVDLNLCLVTRQDDIQWSKYVYWIVQATFYAEENNISFDSMNDMPEVNLFGRGLARMFRDAILVVGNYGDIYEKNLEPLIHREGRNLLNPISNPGPQLYALPGLLDPNI